MKKKLLIGAALILSVGMACTSGAGDWQSYSGDKRIEERVDSVLALMTLEEKIGQMTQYSAKSDIVTGPQVNTGIEPLLKKGPYSFGRVVCLGCRTGRKKCIHCRCRSFGRGC